MELLSSKSSVLFSAVQYITMSTVPCWNCGLASHKYLTVLYRTEIKVLYRGWIVEYGVISGKDGLSLLQGLSYHLSISSGVIHYWFSSPKSNVKKWSQIWKLLLTKGVKSPRKKVFFFGEFTRHVVSSLVFLYLCKLKFSLSTA